MLKKYRVIIFTKSGMNILDNIKRKLLHECFFLYYHVQFQPTQRITDSDISQTAQQLFSNVKGSRETYSIRFFYPIIPGQSTSQTEAFFVLLLLIMQLEKENNRSNYDEWYLYLVRAPIIAIKKAYNVAYIRKSDSFSIERGQKIVEELIKKYYSILYPNEYEEYRTDFLWLKMFYENMFYRCKYDIKQGHWNSL